jgi:TonB family protein
MLTTSFAAATPGQATPPPASTAGEVALLGNKLDGPAVEAVVRAIGSGDAMVRAVAARIAAVTAHAPLAPAIAKAWETERDPAAAGEQVRALLFIRGADALSAIDARLRDLPPASVDVYALWLATNQPERLADLLPNMVSRTGSPGPDISDRVFSALKTLEGRPEAGERLLRSWLAVSTPARWRSLLERLAATSGNAWRDAVLIEALKASDAGIREATVWHLVARVARSQPVTSAVLGAATEQPAPDTPTWESFGRELLARRESRSESVGRADLLTSESRKHLSDARAIALMPQLTSAERQALKAVLGSSFPSAAPEKLSRPPVDPTGSLRTIPILWPGFLHSVLVAAKCNVEGSPTLGLASAVYRADGRIAKLQIFSKPLTSGCSDAVSALARLTLVDPERAPATRSAELLVLPIDRGFVECSSKLPPEPVAPVRIGGPITPPKKTRDVRPIYPPEAQARGITGFVTMEGIISPAGCMTSMTITRSAMPAMDLAALQAVSGWQFTPTLVDGKPTPVIMTITVNFSLR